MGSMNSASSRFEAHTISFRPDDRTPLPENAVVHIILGMWMEGWGLEQSEAFIVTDNGAELLYSFPRPLVQKLIPNSRIQFTN